MALFYLLCSIVLKITGTKLVKYYVSTDKKFVGLFLSSLSLCRIEKAALPPCHPKKLSDAKQADVPQKVQLGQQILCLGGGEQPGILPLNVSFHFFSLTVLLEINR